jgi:hypothetical protein
VELEEGFVKETGANKFDSPAVSNLSQFTTNATGPQVQVDEPQDGSTAVTNNTFIRYTYDRLILAGNGSYYLYKEIPGSPDEELAVYNPSDSTANCVISGNQITLDTTGLIDANETYYVLIDEGAVEDKDGLLAFGFDNDQEHRWTTAASTNVDFPDLTSLQASLGTLTCEVTKNPNYEYGDATLSSTFTSTLTGDPVYKAIDMVLVRSFTRDTGTEIFEFQTPVIDEPPTLAGQNYTIEFTSSNGTFGDTDDLFTDYSTYTFTGTITQCNSQFEKIVFYPNNGTAAGASLSATYTQKRAGVTQLTKTLALNNTGNATDSTNIRYDYITSSGTFTPSVSQLKYKTFHYVVVGAGGGGGGVASANVTNTTQKGGGGGGGEVKSSIGNSYGVTGSGPFSFSNTTISATIGVGGSLGSTGNSGGNGGSTSLVLNGTNTITANGGYGGSSNGTGGQDGAQRFNGGTNGSFKAGGMGAGSGDTWMDQSGNVNTVGYTGHGGNAINEFNTYSLGYGWNQSYFGVPGQYLTGWQKNEEFARGGGGGGNNGPGLIHYGTTGESASTGYYTNPNNNIRYYFSDSVDYPDTNVNLPLQRGQGGGGSGRDFGTNNIKPGHEGINGVVALKYF